MSDDDADNDDTNDAVVATAADNETAAAVTPPHALVVYSRFFAAKPDDAQQPHCSIGAKPLERCLHWLDTEASSTLRFIAIGHVQAPLRWCIYEACEVSLLRVRRERSTRGAPRFEDEIVGTGRPVHAFLDIDANFDAATAASPALCAEAHRAARLRAVALDALIGEAARRLFGVTEQRACHYDASKPDKFSRHVVYHWRDARGHVVAFRSSLACAEFMRHFIDAEPSIDMQVYDEHHALRMYGSSKPDGTRPFVRVLELSSGTCEPPLHSFVWSHFADSLVTLVPPDARLVGDAATAAAVAAQKKRRSPSPGGGSFASRPLEVSADDWTLLESLEPLVAAGIRHVKRDGHLLIVDIASRYCDTKGGEHAGATVYYIVDTERRRYRQRCHASTCKQRKESAAAAAAAWRSYATTYKRASPSGGVRLAAEPTASPSSSSPSSVAAAVPDSSSLPQHFDRKSIVSTLF